MSDDSLQPDPAAILGAAVSLYLAAKTQADTPPAVSLSECYNGGDEFMRQVMRIATLFETWACRHVFFEALDEVWPYTLEDSFGPACLAVLFGPQCLAGFDEECCLMVARKLRLPIKVNSGVPVPFDACASNPAAGAHFHEFRIQTMRRSVEEGLEDLFTDDDEPFDEEWDAPFFSLSGVGPDGVIDPIADRPTYAAAVELAQKLAPGLSFPSRPFVCVK